MVTYDLLLQVLEDSPTLEGVTPADIAELPDPLRESLQEALRVGTISLSKLAGDIGLDRKQARRVAELLVDRGFLTLMTRPSDRKTVYRIRLARRKGRDVPTDIWSSITSSSDTKES
jgi:hypothetical protein